jgi:sec-independent protein translocase protein TatA
MGFNLLFFNISTGEIFIILLIVFIIFGPGKIPEIAKKLGRALYEIKRASFEIKREINSEINKIERDKIKTKPEKTENTPEKSK